MHLTIRLFLSSAVSDHGISVIVIITPVLLVAVFMFFLCTFFWVALRSYMRKQLEPSASHSTVGTSISGTEKQTPFDNPSQHLTAGQSLNIDHSTIPLDPPPPYAATQCSHFTMES